MLAIVIFLAVLLAIVILQTDRQTCIFEISIEVVILQFIIKLILLLAKVVAVKQHYR
jgi:hypothetical protein